MECTNYQSAAKVTDIKTYLLENKPEFLFYGFQLLFSKYLRLPEIFFRCFYFFIILFFDYLTFRNDEKGIFHFSIFLSLGTFIMMFSGVRQSIAMAICAYAIKCFIEKDLSFRTMTKLVLFVFIACLFHTSAIICLLIPLSKLFSVKRTNFTLLLPFLFFVPLIVGNLITVLSNITYFHYQRTTYRTSFVLLIYIVILILYFLILQNNKISLWLKKIFKIDEEITKKRKEFGMLTYEDGLK